MARFAAGRRFIAGFVSALLLALGGCGALAENAAAPNIPTPEPTHAPATITITAVGDCTLGTYRTGSGRTSKFGTFVEKYGYDNF